MADLESVATGSVASFRLSGHPRVQFLDPIVPPPPKLPSALAEDSPYRQPPHVERPEPIRKRARKQLMKVVKSMQIHEQREKHGVTHFLKNKPARIRLPPATKAKYVLNGQQEVCFTLLYRPELADYSLGPDLIAQWRADLDPEARVSQPRPVGLAADGQLLYHDDANSAESPEVAPSDLRGSASLPALGNTAVTGMTYSASEPAIVGVQESVTARLEPAFYLVNRQAEPPRVPPNLQSFWDRNPQLLPKDAFSPVNTKRQQLTDTLRTTVFVRSAPITYETDALLNHPPPEFHLRESQKATLAVRAESRRLQQLDYGIQNVDMSTEAKLATMTPRSQAHVWGGTVSPLPGIRTGAGTTVGAADVELMGLSAEMRVQFGAHVAARGFHDGENGIWTDEINSELARPLDATVFCSRPLQLAQPGTADAYALDSYGGANHHREARKFPYGPVAHEAAARIQRAYGRLRARRVRAATLFQALVRGYMIRKPFLVARALSMAAAVRIQCLIRMFLAKRYKYRLWCAAQYGNVAKFQALWRGVMARRYANYLRHLRNNRLALKIQRIARGYIARARVEQLRWERFAFQYNAKLRSAVVLQRITRGFIGRCRARHRLAFAVRIMDWWRRMYSKKRNAAINIQRVGRGWLARRAIRIMMATRIQAAARRMFARIITAQMRAALEAAEEARRLAEDKAVEQAADVAVDECRDFLETKNGKAKLKEQLVVVKQQEKARAEARKKMTEAEKREDDALQAFELFDADGSNSIDIDEFRLIMQELCVPMNAEQLREAFGKIDADGGGSVDFQEFLVWYQAEDKEDEEEEPEPTKEDEEPEPEDEEPRKGGPKQKLIGKEKRLAREKERAKKKAQEEAERKKAAKASSSKGGSKQPANASAGLAMAKLQLKGRKFVKDLFGFTARQAARRALLAKARHDAATSARKRFRRSRPPPYACPRCVRTFVFRRPYLGHLAGDCDPADMHP